MRTVFAIIKILSFLCVCAITVILFIIGLLFQNHRNLFYIPSKIFSRSTCFIFGVKVRTEGTIDKDSHVVYVSNHLSYIDIPVIGSILSATFISKADVRSWPIFGLLASLSKTIFIERNRGAAVKCITDINKSLNKGRSLILFPEGTSTQGIDVLPFKSSIFELFLDDQLKNKLIVQPLTLNLKQVDGRPVKIQSDYDFYAWYGDMTMLPHLWAIAKGKGAEILITFHPPRKAADYNDRKVFAADCHKDVVAGLDFTAKAP